MPDLLVVRLLPAAVFGLAVAGLLWLVGLIRKRAAMAAATSMAAIFVAGVWPASILAAGQLASVSVAGWALSTAQRLRMRDALGLQGAAVVAAAGLLTQEAPTYWNAAFTGALGAAAGAWVARAASDHWSGQHLRLLSLRATDTGGANGPGALIGAVLVAGVAAAAMALDILGPGEPALVWLGAIAGVVIADSLRPDGLGYVGLASVLGGAAAAGLVAYIP